jgi:hypothetical protein
LPELGQLSLQGGLLLGIVTTQGLDLVAKLVGLSLELDHVEHAQTAHLRTQVVEFIGLLPSNIAGAEEGHVGLGGFRD